MQHSQGVDDVGDVDNTSDSAPVYAAKSAEGASQPQSPQRSSADHSTQQEEVAGGPVPAFGELTLDADEEHTAAASQAQSRTESAGVHLGKAASKTQQVCSSHSPSMILFLMMMR